MHRACISTIIFTHVFSPQHRTPRLDSILFTLPTFYVIFILFPTPYLPCFQWFFSSIFSTEFQLELYGIFSPCSWHVAKLGPNIFILSQSDQHPFSVLHRVQKSSFHHVVPANIKPCNGFEFLLSSSLPATTASHFVHSSLVDQLYAKEVYFCNFVTKSNNPVQHAPNIHPNIFNIFHRTVILGESYGIFTGPSPSNGVFIITVHYKTSSFCYLPIFSLLEPSKQLKSKFAFSPSENDPGPPDLNCGLIFIRPMV